MGETPPKSSENRSERSSSACSGMLGSMAKPLHETGYDSSMALLRGLLRRPLLNGEAGLRGVMNAGVMNLPLESTPGDECALCIRGIVNPLEVCGLVIVEGELFLE